MRQFSIDLCKAGEPVCTRDGREVKELTLFESRRSTHKLLGIVNGLLLQWQIDGHFLSDNRLSDFDLFHPEPEMWVNVWQTSRGLDTGLVFRSKEEAESRKVVSKGDYIGTYKLVKE